MERPQDGQTADLYFEPNEFDSFEQTYAVNVVYADGQTAKTELKATSHTDHQLKTGATCEVRRGGAGHAAGNCLWPRW